MLYANVGSADMPAPILIIKNGQIGGMRLFATNGYSPDDLVFIGAASRPAGMLRRAAPGP